MSVNPTPPSKKSPSPLPLGFGKPSSPALHAPPSPPQRAGHARDAVARGSSSVKPYDPVTPIEAVANPKTSSDDPGTPVSGLGIGTKTLPGVPGAFSLSRWPGLNPAFDFAENATLEALTGEYEYIWLADLGPEVLDNSHPAIAAQVMRIAPLETELYAVRTNPKDFKVSPSGEISFFGSSGKNWDSIRYKLGLHHSLMLRLLAAIGLGQVTNPTVRGCTWLVPWQVTKALADRTAIEIEAGLVVMPEGGILQRNATLMLQNAWDLGAEDPDRFVTCLQADPLLISNQQRERWGIGMHLQGRVFWCVEPPETEKKAKAPKKSKPQVRAELLRESVARAR